jgi:hypothetical protein
MSEPKRGMPRGHGDDEFWQSRPELKAIRSWARARRVGPYAVLGEVLARVVCRIPPAVQLPAIIGGNGSLNMLIASVGGSGEGKGAAAQAAEVSVDWSDDIEIIPPGSGEGLAKSFGIGKQDKATGDYVTERTRYRALLTVSEIDAFAALKSRSGATLSPQLRSLYSGEDLGFGYADPSKRVVIRRHTYRAVLVAGVQPGRGEALLDETDGGLPQRFVWLPAGDPDASAVRPDDPPLIKWTMPQRLQRIQDDDTRPCVLQVCAVAWQTIDSERVKRLRGDGHALDGHALYTLLKLAAALALLDGEISVRHDDWDLSGHLMAVSDRTRGEVSGVLQATAARRNVERGHADAERAEIVTEHAAESAVKRVCGVIVRKLGKQDGWTSRRDLQQAAGRDGAYFTAALEALETAGTITAEGKSYRAADH